MLPLLQEFLDLTPLSGQNVEYHVTSNKGGCTFWVKFEMNSADFNASFTDLTLVKELSATTQLEDELFSVLSSQQGWSQPEYSLAGYVEDVYSRQFQWIFIDTYDQAKWTVYIISNHWPQFNG